MPQGQKPSGEAVMQELEVGPGSGRPDLVVSGSRVYPTISQDAFPYSVTCCVHLLFLPSSMKEVETLIMAFLPHASTHASLRFSPSISRNRS